MSPEDCKKIALIAGMNAGLHDQLWILRESQNDEIDIRDIDSAQVYLEAVHWKLSQILERNDS